MGRVHVTAHGSFAPDVFVSALTDFGPGRAQVFGNTAAEGGTDIDLSIVRVPSTAKGRVLDLLLRLGGGLFFARDLKRTVQKLERRVSPAP